MVNYRCTQCGWTGPESGLKNALICPDCFTGHSPLSRLMKIAGNYVCPNCDWKGEESDAIKSPECPQCGDEYLRVIE